MTTQFPKCSTWPKSGAPRTDGLMWSRGFRYCTPFPAFYETVNFPQLGIAPFPFNQEGHLTFFGATDVPVIAYTWHLPGVPPLLREIRWKYDEVIDPVGNAWFSIPHNLAGEADIKIIQFNWYREWVSTPPSEEFVARKAAGFLIGNVDTMPFWVNAVDCIPRPDDWIPA